MRALGWAALTVVGGLGFAGWMALAPLATPVTEANVGGRIAYACRILAFAYVLDGGEPLPAGTCACLAGGAVGSVSASYLAKRLETVRQTAWELALNENLTAKQRRRLRRSLLEDNPVLDPAIRAGVGSACASALARRSGRPAAL